MIRAIVATGLHFLAAVACLYRSFRGSDTPMTRALLGGAMFFTSLSAINAAKGARDGHDYHDAICATVSGASLQLFAAYKTFQEQQRESENNRRVAYPRRRPGPG